MPIVAEETVRERRPAKVRPLYLLLVAPLLLIAALASALVRPMVVQVGPMVFLAASDTTSAAPFAAAFPVPAGAPIDLPDRSFAVTGSGQGAGIGLAGRVFVVACFRGHRL
jgi:hypothetical protein